MGSYHKGIYINDQYYKYTGGGSVGSIISPTCNNEKELVCGKDEHKHTDECYGSFDTLEKFSNNLWKLNKADTGIVNADGSTVVNVYFERTEFTMNFYNKKSRFESYTNSQYNSNLGKQD